MGTKFMTVAELRAALVALGPEWDDAEVSLNSEYGATAVEPRDFGKERVFYSYGKKCRAPRYHVDINGY